MGGGARRFRSSSVALPAVTVVAASMLSSCNLPGQQRRVCVDARQNVINMIECQRPGGIGRYYFLNGGSGFGIGSHASGGSFSSGHSSSGPSAGRVGRGGFGGHASGG